MACGGEIEFMSPAFLEVTELYDEVAHHVGVGRQATADGVECVTHHVFPVFVVKGDNLKRQTIAGGDEAAHLNIFVGRAVVGAVVAAYAYVK